MDTVEAILMWHSVRCFSRRRISESCLIFRKALCRIPCWPSAVLPSSRFPTPEPIKTFWTGKQTASTQTKTFIILWSGFSLFV